MKVRQNIASWVASWRERLPKKSFLCVLALIVGAASGFAAALLKDLISMVSHVVKDVFPVDHLNVLLLVLPVIGILLCGIFCRYLIKDNMEFGCQRIQQALNSGNYKLKRHIAFAPAVACALTVGFGGSAGSEGPIAYTGAGLGSNIGRYFKLPPETLRVLIIIGAAAGIAGIFKAPIGGSIFALEVLQMPMTTVTVIALIFACLTAAFVAYACSGFTMDIPYLPTEFFDTSNTLAVVLLGVFCALYSLYYMKVGQYTERWFVAMRNPWVKNLVSGALVGAMIFVFPALYGEGYGLLTQIINGHNGSILDGSPLYHVGGMWGLIAFLAGTILLKSVATYATNSGGGVGGEFAPTLFAGCMAGLLFAYVSNNLFGTHINEAHFALFGMAGVMAGTIQAPLMAIFLTAEMVGDIGMFFPLTITAVVSYTMVWILSSSVRKAMSPSWRHNIAPTSTPTPTPAAHPTQSSSQPTAG